MNLWGTAQVTTTQTPLKVNGVNAVSSDGFATWTASMVLSNGLNELVLTTSDGAPVARVAVEKGLILDAPSGIAIDADRGRALVSDLVRGSVVAIDLDTGDRTAFSDTSSSLDFLRAPIDVELDSVRGRALVLDKSVGSDFGRVVAVDLASGQLRGVGGALHPIDLIVDVLHGRALMTTRGDLVYGPASQDGVRAIDLVTGVASYLSTNTIPDGQEPFVQPSAIAIDPQRDRTLVVDGGRVVAVDLITGARSIVPSAGAPQVGPMITIDEPNNRAFVGNLYEVNLTTGETKVFLSLYGYSRLAVDSARNQLIATDSNRGTVEAVDLATKVVKTVATRSTIPSEDNPLSGDYLYEPDYLDIDSVGNRALLVDEPTQGQSNVIGIDLATGQRTLISSNQQSNRGAPLGHTGGIAMDATHGRALIVDRSSLRVSAVDLVSGVRSIVSDNSTADIGEPFLDPSDIVVDRDRNRALVLDAGRDAIFQVDLDTGQRRIFSDAVTPDSANPFNVPAWLALDRRRNRVLVVDVLRADFRGEREAIIAVDLATGHREVIASDSSVCFPKWGGIAVDEIGDRILLIDSPCEGGVIAIDPVTGAQSPFTGRLQQNPASSLFIPSDVAVEPVTGRVFILNDHRELLAVNRRNGDRVFLSHFSCWPCSGSP